MICSVLFLNFSGSADVWLTLSLLSLYNRSRVEEEDEKEDTARELHSLPAHLLACHTLGRKKERSVQGLTSPWLLAEWVELADGEVYLHLSKGFDSPFGEWLSWLLLPRTRKSNTSALHDFT